MDAAPLTSQNPFGALSFVAAPAILTNASSVLAMSTINRMLRTRDSMRDLLALAKKGEPSPKEAQRLIGQINRVERQSSYLMKALYLIYIALAAFACATLVALLGATLSEFNHLWLHIFAFIGIVLGFIGVGGLTFGSINLFHATQASLANIRDEAVVARDLFNQTR